MQFSKRIVITISTLLAIQITTSVGVAVTPNQKLQSFLDPSEHTIVSTKSEVFAIQTSNTNNQVFADQNDTFQYVLNHSDKINHTTLNFINQVFAYQNDNMTEIFTEQIQTLQYLPSRLIKVGYYTIIDIFGYQINTMTETFAEQNEKLRYSLSHLNLTNLDTLTESFANETRTLIESFTFFNEKIRHLLIYADQINLDTVLNYCVKQSYVTTPNIHNTFNYIRQFFGYFSDSVIMWFLYHNHREVEPNKITDV